MARISPSPSFLPAALTPALRLRQGMHAVRKNRYVIIPADFEKGYTNNIQKDESDFVRLNSRRSLRPLPCLLTARL